MQPGGVLSGSSSAHAPLCQGWGPDSSQESWWGGDTNLPSRSLLPCDLLHEGLMQVS